MAIPYSPFAIEWTFGPVPIENRVSGEQDLLKGHVSATVFVESSRMQTTICKYIYICCSTVVSQLIKL